jgi:hypothetical protein
MKNISKLGAGMVLLAAIAACDQSPTNESPALTIGGGNGIVGTSATPSPEEVDLCKVGGTGTFNFTVTETGPDAADSRSDDATDGSVQTAAGQCERIAFNGGERDTVIVTEVGASPDSIVIQQLSQGVTTVTKLTGTSTARATLAGLTVAEGAVITFYNPAPAGGQPSIQINSVRITSADRTDNGGTCTVPAALVPVLGATIADPCAVGTFVVANMSGGNTTIVTLGTVSVSFVAKGGGDEGVFNTSCTTNATGAVLPAGAKNTTFAFACGPLQHVSGKLTNLANASELTAIVKVDGIFNQNGDFRPDIWTASSPTFKF